MRANVLMSLSQALEFTKYVKQLFTCVYSTFEHSDILHIYILRALFCGLKWYRAIIDATVIRYVCNNFL